MACCPGTKCIQVYTDQLSKHYLWKTLYVLGAWKLWHQMANISGFLKLSCLFWTLSSVFPLLFIYNIEVNIKLRMKRPESLEAEIFSQVCSRWYSTAMQATRCFPAFNLNSSNSEGASLFSCPFKTAANPNFKILLIGSVTARGTRLGVLPLRTLASTTPGRDAQLINLMCKSPCSNTNWIYNLILPTKITTLAKSDGTVFITFMTMLLKSALQWLWEAEDWFALEEQYKLEPSYVPAFMQRPHLSVLSISLTHTSLKFSSPALGLD